MAHAVVVTGIEQADPGVQGRADGGDAFGLVGGTVAAATVAQLILEGDESASGSIDKALTNGTWSPVAPEVTKGGEARNARSDGQRRRTGIEPA
jgi:hypothetical protein